MLLFEYLLNKYLKSISYEVLYSGTEYEIDDVVSNLKLNSVYNIIFIYLIIRVIGIRIKILEKYMANILIILGNE